MKKLILSTLLTLPLLANGASVEQLFSVQSVKVKKENIAKKSKNYGFVKPDESKVYDITPRFSGFVEVLYADKIYKKVKKNQALALVYSPEVFKAKDDYLNAYKYTKNKDSKGMLESAKLKLKLLGVSQKEIDEVIKNKKASEFTTIYSPANGYIFEKNINKGSAFNAKSKLFQIVNLDQVWVEAKLFEEQYKDISKVKKYQLKFKGLDKTYETKSKLLYPSLNPKESTMTLRLKVDNPKHKLFPGMYANIFSLEKAEDTLTLPSTAVIKKDGKYYVFMLGEFEGEYEPLEVSVKAIDSNTYSIIDGLNEGDEVVNNALFMMDSDAQINSLY